MELKVCQVEKKASPRHRRVSWCVRTPAEQLSAAAVRYRIAVGPQAGRKTMTLRNPRAMVDDTTSSKPFTAARDGFSINAAVGCEARERGKLERVCRYMARPPIAEQRLSIDGDALVVYELKRPFSDGTGASNLGALKNRGANPETRFV